MWFVDNINLERVIQHQNLRLCLVLLTIRLYATLLVVILSSVYIGNFRGCIDTAAAMTTLHELSREGACYLGMSSSSPLQHHLGILHGEYAK